MAVPGRKQTDMIGSIALGSVEDFDHKCEPCLTVGQHVEAHGLCVQCQEYLCKTCHDCHRRMKFSRSHQIIGRGELDRIQTTRKSYHECIEHCSLHQTEIIKFYCTTHATLGCNDCMTIDHRTCKIDYIPEKCTGIADGKEYTDIVMKLSKKLIEAEEVAKEAERGRSDINDINNEIIEKITELRTDINNRLDQIQEDILRETEKIKSNNKTIVQMVIDTCENIISDVNTLQSSIIANKSNNQIGQLYIDFKRAESALQSDKLNEAKEKLMNMNIQYSFRRSTDLENLLSKEMVFGELINHPQPESTKKKNIIDHLNIENDINVQTKTDKKGCWITGCVVLTPDRLVLAEYYNQKVKVVSVENKLVLQEKVLNSRPFDIAVMSENQFAVTIPGTSRIDVMTADDELSCIRSIKVDGECYGIKFHQDNFYVACLDPNSVVVLSTKWKVLSNIPLNFLSLECFPYIAVRKDSNLLYISDTYSCSLVSVSLHGDVTATCKHDDLDGPWGICLLDDGSLLVCSYDNGTILQVKGDLKEGKIMHKYLTYPTSIYYSARNAEVYVGCYGGKLKVLKF